jgi:formylglycine-generating enzyme required for sulfatase activity
LFDMYGNVQEWCNDVDAAKPTYRLLCGGTFKWIQAEVNSNSRLHVLAEDRWEIIGFRMVRTVSAPGSSAR